MHKLRPEPKAHATKLTAQGERALKSDHPWIFDQAIEKISPEAKVGDKMIIFDRKKNKFLGIGLFDPHSPIRIKVLLPRERTRLDQAWFKEKFQNSLNIRKPLFEKDTNSFRWIFGENDGLPSLIVDVYNQVVVIKLYSLIWLPYLHDIIAVIPSLYDTKAIVLRLSRQVKLSLEEDSSLSDGQVIYGTLDDEVVIFEEHGVKFSANVIHGHKTGYFLDHRDNRREIGVLSKDKDVLDVFSYAGGFSVHALVGGAKKVVSVDISNPALELAKFNAKLNGEFSNHETRKGDAFLVMSDAIQKGERFDIVMVDPPSFAKSKKEIPAAEKAYGRLAEMSIKLTKKGGMLVLASCSSRVSKELFTSINEEHLSKSRRKYRLVKITDHDIDHPINFPEGAYLKCAYYQFDN